jgi:hypothetical protein
MAKRHSSPPMPGSIVAEEYYVFGFFLGITADFDICLRGASREGQRILTEMCIVASSV